MKHLRWIIPVLLLVLAWAKWAPMRLLFRDPCSTVLLDREGELLAANVAADGQWRMPPGDTLPARFITCLLEFEDRHFNSHWGIHIPSLIRATKQNISAGAVISGGSTITMQVARMSGGDRSRSILNKLSEMLFALRLELRLSKDEILLTYVANAPFGGNVVGLEAAAWRWFGRAPAELGWAECATLAVLPNAPSKMHPGKGREALLAKRDRLLDRLLGIGVLDTLSWSLAKEEPLPNAPHALPRKAPHLLGTLHQLGLAGKRIRSTLDALLQDRVTVITDRYAQALHANEVHNAAVLVLDVATGEVLAYVGNLPSANAEQAGDVDIIRARRSTGSLLKPFLFADMLQSGERMPDQLVADLPTHYNGFAPRNFDQQFDGAVPASQALARSLNVPAVRALHEHGIERTLRMFRTMGLAHIDRTTDNYGLSLIVGGAESTLWELTGAYASMARSLLGGDLRTALHPPICVLRDPDEASKGSPPPLSPAAAYHTIRALQTLNRPESEAGWQHFAGSKHIAWKTGTSFGHRDAWAIGITDKYAVGVWTGNADGEGRPGLTGSLAAAPILFAVFDILPRGNGFDAPFDDLVKIPVCHTTGFRAGPDCTPVDSSWTIREAVRTSTCPYHRRIRVNAAEDRRVALNVNGHFASWFCLPPAMEHYYKMVHPAYRPLPPSDLGTDETPIGMIYPESGARILVPVLLDGSFSRVVLMAAHRDGTAKLHWDLDGSYVGTTTSDHELGLDLSQGTHQLTLTDQRGNVLRTTFAVERGAIDGTP